ncbi:hypothetical protein PUN28_007359 [Cardiocondyla obscurior]|uniref:Uncharacterized protein n=1 Tax=Cardiocondyla obscurior TaxID=286306 RepID=A0AAW2G7U9_9HYME
MQAVSRSIVHCLQFLPSKPEYLKNRAFYSIIIRADVIISQLLLLAGLNRRFIELKKKKKREKQHTSSRDRLFFFIFMLETSSRVLLMFYIRSATRFGLPRSLRYEAIKKYNAAPFRFPISKGSLFDSRITLFNLVQLPSIFKFGFPSPPPPREVDIEIARKEKGVEARDGKGEIIDVEYTSPSSLCHAFPVLPALLFPSRTIAIRCSSFSHFGTRGMLDREGGGGSARVRVYSLSCRYKIRRHQSLTFFFFPLRTRRRSSSISYFNKRGKKNVSRLELFCSFTPRGNLISDSSVARLTAEDVNFHGADSFSSPAAPSTLEYRDVILKRMFAIFANTKTPRMESNVKLKNILFLARSISNEYF